MKDMSPEQRWTVRMVQARNFAAKEQYVDAVARAGEVRAEIEGALAGETDAARKARLQRQLERVKTQHEAYKAEFERWRAAIRVRRQERIEHAPEEMERPLPLPPPPVR